MTVENPLGFPILEGGEPVRLMSHEEIVRRKLGQVKRSATTRRNGLPPLPEVKEFVSMQGEEGIKVSFSSIFLPTFNKLP